MRHEALRLLSQCETTSGFLESPPALMASAVIEDLMGAPRLQEGAILAGRFRISRFVGRGGMGEIYAADDLRSGARLALKVIGRLASPEPNAIAWLRDELNLARTVTHRNVCRVFELHAHAASGDAPEMLFLTMEFLNGGTLAERLADGGRMPFKQAENLACQLAAGLSAAHQAGVVHRDLKTTNVMLVPRESGFRAVIMDFGIASADLREAPPGRAPMGTPAYMAPEQAEGPATPASDIYSFGLVVGEALHGTRPKAGRPSTSRPESHVPRWFTAILRKCVQPNPAARYRNGVELLVALRERRRDRRLRWTLVAITLIVAGVPAWVAFT